MNITVQKETRTDVKGYNTKIIRQTITKKGSIYFHGRGLSSTTAKNYEGRLQGDTKTTAILVALEQMKNHKTPGEGSRICEMLKMEDQL